MDRQTVLTALKTLSDTLGSIDDRQQITVIGGAAILLTFPDFPRGVKDIDCFYDFDSPSEDVMSLLIEEVAEKLELPSDWMNNGVQPYIWLPDNLTFKTITFRNLLVRIPNSEYLLASKIDSGRKIEKANDVYDVGFLTKQLGLKTKQQVMGIYRMYFPKGSPSSFALEEAYHKIEGEE